MKIVDVLFEKGARARKDRPYVLGGLYDDLRAKHVYIDADQEVKGDGDVTFLPPDRKARQVARILNGYGFFCVVRVTEAD